MATLSAARAHPAAVSPTAEPAPTPAGFGASLSLMLRFGIVMAAVLAAASLPASSFVAVREIAVIGARTVAPRDVIARSGIRPGARLLGISTARAETRLVAEIPRVASARISAELNGRVTIRIEERRPYAVVPFRGRYLVLDRSGVVMDAARESGLLPVVSADAFAPPWMRMGDRLPDRRVAAATQALAELPREILTPGVKLRALASGDLILITPDGIAVRLGPLRGLRERAALLPQLVRAVRTRGLAVEYLDLRFAGSVVMKPVTWPGAGERP